MKKWFKENTLVLLGALTGAMAGFFYWKFVGCLSGTCAITSDPINSTIFGALMGGLFFGLFRPSKSKSSIS